MTTMEETGRLAGAVTAAINAAGLKLEESKGLPDLDGGLTGTVFTDATGDESNKITMATVTEVGIEVFDVASEAIQGAETGLNPGTPTAFDSVTALDVSRPIGSSHHVITHGGHPIGLVIIEEDRRAAAPAQDPGDDRMGGATAGNGDAPSPVDAAAEYAPQSFSMPEPTTLTGEGNLTMLSDVMLDVTVELGRQSLRLSQVLNLSIGSVVELDRAAGAPVDVRVNGILFGRGEVVVVDNEYAVRVIEILEQPSR